jgi:hypothetical protein
MNWSAIHVIEGTSETTDPQPKWSKEQAGRIALAFAAVLFPEMAKSVRIERLEFETSGRNVTIGKGTWEVLLRRISRDGYPFDSDFINVSVNEHLGPLAAVMRIPSHFQERAFHLQARLQMNIAVSRAFQNLQSSDWALQHPEVARTLTPVGSPGLCIVNKAGIYGTDNKPLAEDKNVDAILVWVAMYEYDMNPNGPHTSAWDMGRLRLCIDPESGNLLGQE